MIKRSLALIALTGLLGACGFHLRGTTSTTRIALNELNLTAHDTYGETQRELRSQLEANGVKVYAGAPYELVLANETEKRRTASYTSTSRSTPVSESTLQRGVTSFLPTAPTLAADDLPRFADRVRAWMPEAPADGAEPLGFNLEGPFIAPARKGAHDPALLRTPDDLEPEIVDAVAQHLPPVEFKKIDRLGDIGIGLPPRLATFQYLPGRKRLASLTHQSSSRTQYRNTPGGRRFMPCLPSFYGTVDRLPDIGWSSSLHLTDDFIGAAGIVRGHERPRE